MLDFEENLQADELSVFDSFDLSDSLLQDEQSSTMPNGEKFIVFYLDNKLFAVSANLVAEVFPLSAVTPLPNTPEWLLGIANVRGEIISVVDLGKLSGGKKSVLSEKSKLIVMRSQNTDDLISVAADKLSEMITLSSEDVGFIKEETLPHILGKFIYKSKELHLINTESFFQFEI